MTDNNLSQDEYYDIVAIGLCKAAIKYNKDCKYKFSTYAYHAISNTLKNDKIYDNRHNVETISFNNIVTLEGHDIEDEYVNFLESDEVVEDRVMTRNHFEWFIENMSNRELQICMCKFYNMSDRKISKLFDVNNTLISKIVRRMKKQYAENKRPDSGNYKGNKDDLEERTRLKEKLLDMVVKVV